jgi:predicted amidohydrolase YtcJ
MTAKNWPQLLSITTALGVSSLAFAAADTIYVGGTVITIDDRQPGAEAVAVKDGLITAVGGRKPVLAAEKGPHTTVVDLQGHTLLPGFVDGHGHLSGVGLQAITANLLPAPDGTGNSIAALQKILRDWIAASPVPKQYGIVIGFGYDDSQLAEQRHPTRDDLDQVSKDLPVYLIHQSGHLGAANSKALELAGISATTPNPPGGVIRRRAGSEQPDGVLEENAHYLALSKLVVSRIGEKESLALIGAGQDLYLKYGYTTGEDGATDPGNMAGFIKAAETHRLKMDVIAYPALLMLGQSDFMTGLYSSRQYHDHLRIGGVKIVLDGSPQGKTAWLTQPYFKPPEGQPADYRGYPALTDAQVQAAVDQAFENNWQILAHTNGDAAIDQFLNAVAAAEGKHPASNRRPVMIHGQTVRADQLDRIKELGVFPSLFPMHTYYWGDWHRESVLGPERAANISPTGWALARGLMFSSHHDAPVAFPDSMRVLSATVTRTTRSGFVLGPEQRVEPIVALKAMTLWPAYQHFEETTKGSIEVGKLADFVILSENPLTIDRSRLASIKIVETIKQGKSVYRLDAAAKHAGASGCGVSSECFERLTAALRSSTEGSGD